MPKRQSRRRLWRTPLVTVWPAVLLLAALFAQPADTLEARYEGTGCPLPTNVVLTVSRELARLIQSHQALFRKPPPKEFIISYSLFHFFIAQPQISPFLTSLIDSSVMDQGSGPEQAFADHVDAHWPGGVTALEKGWHSWIHAKAREQRARSKASKPPGPK